MVVSESGPELATEKCPLEQEEALSTQKLWGGGRRRRRR